MCGDKKIPKLGTGLDLPAEAVSRGASPACAHPWGCAGLKAKAYKEDSCGGAGGVGAEMGLDKPQLVTPCQGNPIGAFSFAAQG